MIKDQAFGAVVVYRQDNEEPLFLIVKQAGNYWAFPKGHKEGQETDLETAKRELWEEAGVKEVDWQEQQTFTTEHSFEKDGQTFSKTNTYFLTFAKEKFASAPQSEFSHEILDSAWVPYAKARELLDFPPYIKVLDEVNEYLKLCNS